MSEHNNQEEVTRGVKKRSKRAKLVFDLRNKSDKIHPHYQPELKYPVYIKMAGEKDTQVLYFDRPVYVNFNVISKSISLYDDTGKNVYYAQPNIIETIQIAAVETIQPFFLTKHMNIWCDKDNDGYLTGWTLKQEEKK